MIFFDRRDRPLSLMSGKVKKIQHIIDRHMDLPKRERSQTDVPEVWREPFEEDVLATLCRSTSGMCSFCEAQSAKKVYRFRPPAYADPVKPVEQDASYLWLAFSWYNLFPICASCWPTRPELFPVNGARTARNGNLSQEQAVLIAPGDLSQPYARPYQNFRVRLDGVIEGLTQRGRLVVDHFRLNADDKCGWRSGELDLFLSSLNSYVLSDRSFLSGAPFVGLGGGERVGFKYLMLAQLTEKMMQRADEKWSRSPVHIDETLRRLLRRQDYLELLNMAWADVRRDDETVTMAPVSRVRRPRYDPWEDVALHSSPRLKSVALKTYKSLEKICFDLPDSLPSQQAQLNTRVSETTKTPQAPCMLILGENATGKSSILEGIALTLMPRDARNALKLKASRLPLNHEYMGAQNAVSEAHSEISVRLHSSDGVPEQALLLRIDGDESAPQPFALSHAPKGPLPMVFAYGAHRLYGSQKRRSRLRHVETLFYNDRQLPDPEKWLQKLKPDELDEVVRALRHLIQIDGHFQSIDIDPDTKKCSITFAKSRGGEKYTLTQRLDVVSSGYRAVLALVCDVLEGLSDQVGSVREARNTPAVILIDEIEAHLHPRWKLQIVTGLRRALPQATFIITTHDPLCVRGMFSGEVFALNRYQNSDADGLKLPEMVERVDGFENVESLTIEQILTSELFQLLSTDDPALDHAVAEAADDLAGIETARPQISDIINGALPIGQTDLSRLVHEAIFEYLKEPRGQNMGAQRAARTKAKERIKELLRERMR